jgi:hypothetical protein
MTSGAEILRLEMWRPQASFRRHGAAAAKADATDALDNVRSCRDGILGTVFHVVSRLLFVAPQPPLRLPPQTQHPTHHPNNAFHAPSQYPRHTTRRWRLELRR